MTTIAAIVMLNAIPIRRTVARMDPDRILYRPR